METRVLKASKIGPAAAAREGAKALRAGKLVAFATETVYGVGALATNAAALERLRELKSRPARPFSVHMGQAADAGRYVGRIPSETRRLMGKGWPGPVTILLPTGGALADGRLQKAGLHEVLTSDGVIALRCPDESVARALLSAVKGPVVASSANPARQRSPRDAEEVLDKLNGQIDMLIDSGPTRYGRDSTIVRFDGEELTIVRKGVYSQRILRSLIRRTILFVCTGNTCRSPMAAGLAKRILAERLGCSAGELRGRGIEVQSAGLFAGGGARPTPEAIAAAKARGADIARHRSRKLTAELIRRADVVFCMTDLHVDEARRLVPSAARRIRRLDEGGDITDPIGGGARVYDRTAGRMDKVLGPILDDVLND